MKRETKITLFAVAFVAIVALLVFTPAGAGGFFARCNFLNDCDTFGDMGDWTVKNFQKGILVEGTVPDADLAGSQHPLEVIVTTGDVYTKCSNTNGIKDITGDLLWRGNVQPGHFSVYIPLAEGKYNITVYLGQSVCANCPNFIEVPIDVKHKGCDWNVYILKGNHPCYLMRNRVLGDKKDVLPARYNGTAYMYNLCAIYDCDGELVQSFKWNGQFSYNCDIPECTACP